MSYQSIEEAMLEGHGVERAFICHAHDDHNASASVNSLTGLWFCYTCHARGKFDMSKIQLDPLAFKRRIDQRIALLDYQPRVYPESWLGQFDSTGPGQYWLGRFTEQYARRHRLGQTTGVATIPFRDNRGQVLGVIRRDLTGTDKAKYRYPSGVEASLHLYNYHRVTSRVVVLTEGATDTIAADEAGVTDAVAVYGSHVSPTQILLLQQIDPVRIVCAFDQDEAGHDGYSELVAKLPYHSVVRLEWPVWKDLASIPVKIRSKILLTAVAQGEIG